jgi:hypothetical protein
LLYWLPPLLLTFALFLGLCGGARWSDRALVSAGHLFGHPGERRARRIADAVRATVNGPAAAAIVVMVAASVLTGVPHQMRFTMLTMALAMVPFAAWATLATALLIRLTHGGTRLGFEPASVHHSRFPSVSCTPDRSYDNMSCGSMARCSILLKLRNLFLTKGTALKSGKVPSHQMIFRRLFRELSGSPAVHGEWFPSNQHWQSPCWR